MPDDDVQAIAAARIGQVLRGKYRLDRILGVGGMAVVYAATHRNKKRFAIKMLHPELSVRDTIRNRFLREGYVANTVEHVGAVTVLDDDVAEDGSAFVVMELLEGAPLDAVQARHGGRVPLPIVLAVTDALLEVLVAAHAKGVVHRDLKPANLFLTRSGQLRVLDFGIARLHDDTAGAHSTQTGAMLGTPAYMAPEQALGQTDRVDARTDLWAAGATMFTLLGGQVVHPADNAMQMLVLAGSKHARPLASVSDGVPAPVAAVVDKALAFDRDDRWASAQQMRQALVEACHQATGGPIPPLPPVEPEAGPVTGHEETVTSGEGATRSREALAPTVDAASAPGPSRSNTSAGVASSHSARVPARPVSLRTVGLGLLVCGIVASGVVGYRALRAPRVRYCLSTDVTRDGPRCLFEVAADVVPRRSHPTDRVTEQGGRVGSIEHVTFAGVLDQEVAREDVERDGSGAVRGFTQTDGFGVQIEQQRWSDGGRRIDFVDVDGTTPRHAADVFSEYARDFTDDNRHGAPTSLRVEYDAQGRRSRVQFFGPTGRPRADAAGKYGVELEYGTTPGRIVKQTNLGADGAPAPDQDGVVIERRDDGASPWVGERYFDAAGRPFARAGVHRIEHEHDDVQGTGFSFFGLHDEPVEFLHLPFLPSFSLGFPRSFAWRRTWDLGRRTADSITLDERGKVVGWIQRSTYDERGRISLLEYLDPQGNRVITTNLEGETSDLDGIATNNGASAERFEYDDRGHRTAVVVLDPSGAPMSGVEGFTRRLAKYDDANDPVEVRFEDETGKLAPSSDGAAIERSTFDSRGLELTYSSFDADDHPVANVHGYASRRSKYDRLRNLVEVAYFAPDGTPTVSDEGFATQRWTYDDNDDLVGVAYFDASGLPTIVASTRYGDGFSSVRFRNDERGLFVRVDFLGPHGEPMICRWGYASKTITRDRNGEITEISYLGKNGEPIVREGGLARYGFKYDGARRPVELAIFDTAGRPTRGTKGWAIERSTYDDRGQLLRVDELDENGAPVLASDGYASVTHLVDGVGRDVSQTNLDVAGQPVVSHDGYATKKWAFDERGNVTEEALLGSDGKPAAGTDGWAVRRHRYDDFHDEVDDAFFDATREPVVPKGLTYASKRQHFDARHKVTEVTFFDVRGAPSKGPDGAAIVRFQRDNRGRAVETSYFDGTGTPSPSNDGRLVVRSTFDAASRLTGEHFLDAAGTPRIAQDGCAGHATRYDALGRKVEESCLGVDGQVVAGASHWATRRTLHDAHGNDVEIATYGTDGKLVTDADGIARRRSRYDDRNLLVETEYFDAADKPTHDKGGVHRVDFAYDGARKKTGETSFDERGRVVTPAKH
jgi:serine/threonine protein kinase